MIGQQSCFCGDAGLVPSGTFIMATPLQGKPYKCHSFCNLTAAAEAGACYFSHIIICSFTDSLRFCVFSASLCLVLVMHSLLPHVAFSEDINHVKHFLF